MIKLMGLSVVAAGLFWAAASATPEPGTGAQGATHWRFHQAAPVAAVAGLPRGATKDPVIALRQSRGTLPSANVLLVAMDLDALRPTQCRAGC